MQCIQMKAKILNREDGRTNSMSQFRAAPVWPPERKQGRFSSGEWLCRAIRYRPAEPPPSPRDKNSLWSRNQNQGCKINQIRRNPATTSWRKIYFRHERHYIRADTATSDGWVASRLPWAGLSIIVKRFSEGRQFFRSAAYRSELHPSWIFVQNNSVKVNPLRLPPDRRCENEAKFSSWKPVTIFHHGHKSFL